MLTVILSPTLTIGYNIFNENVKILSFQLDGKCEN